METVKQFVLQYLPEIIAYGLVAIGYIITFVMKHRSTLNSNSLRALFKENDNNNKKEFVGINEKYNALVDKYNELACRYDELDKKIAHQKETIELLIGGKDNDRE